MLKVIRFTSPTCVPCKSLGPKLDQLATEHPDVEFQKVNVFEQPEIAAEFGVMGVPRVFFIKNGQVVADFAGDKPKEFIENLISENV